MKKKQVLVKCVSVEGIIIYGGTNKISLMGLILSLIVIWGISSSSSLFQHVLQINNSHFEFGSLFISTPETKVILQEDIIFGKDWGPTHIPDARAISPLGWFAAIVVTANGVDIDLNGFEIRMDPIFYVHQRFFALIELADKPFIISQGPANFGKFHCVSNVNIYNGSLGLSSHHGIHGNNVTDLHIWNLRIRDFEVGAIHINGARKLQIHDVRI